MKIPQCKKMSSGSPVYPATNIPKELTCRICSVRAKFYLQCTIDLRHIEEKLPNSTYDRQKHKCIKHKIRVTPTTGQAYDAYVMIFASGAVLIMSARSIEAAVNISNDILRVLRSDGIGYKAARIANFSIVDVTGSAEAAFGIRLSALSSKHHKFSTYEPELSSAVVYRMCKPSATLLIFSQGKVVCMGARSEENVRAAVQKIYPVLLEHRHETLSRGIV